MQITLRSCTLKSHPIPLQARQFWRSHRLEPFPPKIKKLKCPPVLIEQRRPMRARITSLITKYSKFLSRETSKYSKITNQAAKTKTKTSVIRLRR